METGAETDGTATLIDLVRLWRVDPSGHTQLLLDTVQKKLEQSPGASPALSALASAGPDVSRAGLARLVTAVEAELGLEVLEGSDIQDAAVAAACRRHLSGDLTPRELTYWVTRVIGLRGSARCQPFLGFEDEYTRFIGYDVSAIDADVSAAAHAFIAPESQGKPSLWARLRRQER